MSRHRCRWRHRRASTRNRGAAHRARAWLAPRPTTNSRSRSHPDVVHPGTAAAIRCEVQQIAVRRFIGTSFVRGGVDQIQTGRVDADRAPHGPKCCASATASRKGWKISVTTPTHSAVRRRDCFTHDTPVSVRTMIILLGSETLGRLARTGRDRYPVAPASLGQPRFCGGGHRKVVRLRGNFRGFQG